MYLFWPETSGRHLEEIDQIFRDSKNIFEPPKMARKLPAAALADEYDHDTGRKASVEKSEAGS